MIGTDSNHCRIVAESLAGKREVDEQTFDSLAALGRNLERLKRIDNVFSGVEFSSHAHKLMRLKTAVAVS